MWLLPETLTFKLLEKYRVAHIIVDEPLIPPEIHVTTDFAYFRWHGKGEDIWFDYRYSPEKLDAWIPKVQETSNKVKKVYGYLTTTIMVMHPKTVFNLLKSWD